MKRLRSRMLYPRWHTAGIAVALVGFFWASISSAELPLPAQQDEISVEFIKTALGNWQEGTGLETTAEGLDQRVKTANDGIDSNTQALADLGGRLDSEIEKLDTVALRLDSLAAQLKQSNDVLEDQGLRLGNRINTLETTAEGLDQRVKTANDGIDSNTQGLADLGSRLDSEIEKLDTVALRLDSLSAQLKQSNEVLEDQQLRLEDNSIKLYEALMGIDSANKELTLTRQTYDRMRSAPAGTQAPDTATDTDMDQSGLLLPLVLCLLVPLAVVVNQAGLHSTATGATTEVKHVAWVLVSWFGGGVGFFLIGIGIMYGSSLGGVIGNPGQFLRTATLSTPVDFPPELLGLLIPNLILASIVAVVVCSSAPQGLTNRGHFLVALLAGGLVYPLFGHWIATPTNISQQSGWLAGSAFPCPAATTNVALLGGILALSLGSGLGLIRSHPTPSSADPMPADTGTASAMLLWVAWIGVILTASTDCLPPSALSLSLSVAAGGAALGVLAVEGVTNRIHERQNRLPFAVLAGIVAAPVAAQEATLLELAVLGALTGVSASLLMRFLGTRSTADIRLASALLVGGIFGTLGPAMFGPTGFLFVRSIDVLAPQLQAMGAALFLGIVIGRALAWPIESTRFLRAPT